MVEPALLVSLGVLSLVGAALAFFGFKLATPLLRLGGTVGGALAGGAITVFVLPALTGGIDPITRLFAGAVLVGVGAIFGYLLLPVLGKLATGVAGFVATTLSTTTVLVGGEVIDAVLSALPEEGVWADPVAVLEAVMSASVFTTASVQQSFAVALVFGVVGGLLALRYYAELISIAATLAGASILGVVIPIWITVGTAETATVGVSQFSLFWFFAAFVAGFGVQLYRYSGNFDPQSSNSAVR